MFQMMRKGKGIFRMGQLIGIDPIKKSMRIDPRAVKGIADTHDVRIMFLGERMNLRVEKPIRIDKCLNGSLKL